MSERLTPTNDFFADILRENLREYREPNTAVITISGLPGAGTTSTSQALADEIKVKYGVEAILFSLSEEARRLSRSFGGLKRSEFLRDPDKVRAVDSAFIKTPLKSENSKRIILGNGRNAGFDMAGLENAGRKYPIPLPFKSVKVYLHAQPDVRGSRKFLDEIKRGTTQTREAIEAKIARQIQDEQGAFKSAYPNQNLTPDNMGFLLEGRPIYDLRYSTDTSTPAQIAEKVAVHPLVKNLVANIQD